MNVIAFLIVFGAFALLDPARVFAQSPQPAETPPRVQAGVGLLIAAPLGDFGTNVAGAAVGVLGHFDASVKRSVWSVGGELSYLQYGRETRTVPLGALIPEIPDVAIEVDTTNAMFILHGRLRAQRRTGRWRPYADGLVGFTDLVTKSSIAGPQVCTGGFLSNGTCVQTEYASQTHLRDVVLSYGGGAGVMIRFGTSLVAPRLDLSARFIRGADGNYLIPGALHLEGDTMSASVSRSTTSFFSVYAGVALGR